MKKILIVYVIQVIGISFLFSCSDKEEYPYEFITPEYVFNPFDSSGLYVEQVLNNLYSYLPDGYNRISNVMLAAATDDAVASSQYHIIEIFSKSKLTAYGSNPDDHWYLSYDAIRKVNMLLKDIDDVPVKQEIMTHWKAEARFIRVMSYFELIKRYSGVPLVGNKIYSQDADINLARSSFSDCVEYIVNEIDEIADLLMEDPISSAQIGKIGKGAALALKSRVLLYAASPLHNPLNDIEKWKEAMKAAKALIDYGKFELNSNFMSVFLERNNKEVILAFQRALSTDLERTNGPVGSPDPNISGGWMSPTQELVDAFPMINGIDIHVNGSGYDENNPYVSRDPRLEQTVFFNGSLWLDRVIQTFEGGKDKPNNGGRQTRTGYYLKKFLGDFSNSEAYGNQSHNFIIFRYAEILLNYAEALNEIGQTNSAYNQLKLIRNRAGIEPGSDGLFGLKEDMTQSEMREAIHNERRLELAFEEHRFWDVRRWKKGEVFFNKEVHGVKIQEGSLDYKITPIFKMIFDPKMYLYPIPNQELSGNSRMAQNPGWE